jgi:hypothetical protein
VLGSVLGALLAACAPTSAAAPPQLHPRLASTTDVGAHAATKDLRATAERGSAMAARDAEVEPGAAGARGDVGRQLSRRAVAYGSALVVELDEHAPGALHGNRILERAAARRRLLHRDAHTPRAAGARACHGAARPRRRGG